jgi:hypothetical protein
VALRCWIAFGLGLVVVAVLTAIFGAALAEAFREAMANR